jgi:hypothetical protein
MEALMLVATLGGPTMFARIGVMRAPIRHVERVFNSDRKDHHWASGSLRGTGDLLACRPCRGAPVSESRRNRRERRHGDQRCFWSGQLDSNTFRFLPRFQIVIPSQQLLVGRLRGSSGATNSMPIFFDLQDPRARRHVSRHV